MRMAPPAPTSSPYLPLFLFSILLLSPNPNPRALASPLPLRSLAPDPPDDPFSILTTTTFFPTSDPDDPFLFHRDYSPPSAPPPPSPPSPPTPPCEGPPLNGTGSFDTLCRISSSILLTNDLHITGQGSFEILPGSLLSCLYPGCTISVTLPSGEFKLGNASSIFAGTVRLEAVNVTLTGGSVINATGLGGDPPAQTSGVPHGVHGDGGGYGGRGASCYRKQGQGPDDSWGGDAYAWDTLMQPFSYGSRGGTTSREEDYGGGGGGRVWVAVNDTLQVDGVVVADGGDAVVDGLGGGGSGGSINIVAYKMNGSGKISASGGNGLAGGGGGRVSVDAFSRHGNQEFLVHGGRSSGCPENNGAAGTLYDAVPRSLTVNNYNLSTQTDTLLMEFPNKPLWTNVYVKDNAKVVVPLLWSRVQVQGTLSLLGGGILSFGLTRYPYSEFELMGEELLMSDSIIRVFGALRMSVKMLLMWNSTMLVDGGGDSVVATSLLEASNLIVLKGASLIHSNANLGIHGQGLLNLSGPGDIIEAQRLILSLFYSVQVGPGSILRGPLVNASGDDMAPRLNCDAQECPSELLHPPEDCNVNSSLSFTLQICRVEDIYVSGSLEGNVIHFNRARSVVVHPSGAISASGLGCKGGIGQGMISPSGLGGGGGHGGRGGDGIYNGTHVEGGMTYGSVTLPCELGSGSGNDSFGTSTAGGGVIVMGSLEHSVSALAVHGSLTADGESFGTGRSLFHYTGNSSYGGPGGGSGGTILLFLRSMSLADTSVISSIGGHGSYNGGGGGGGGRIHFHWSDISTGDEYVPVANVNGSLNIGGGLGQGNGTSGESGSITGKDCPKGLFGIFCKECPLGTFKNVSGSDEALCLACPQSELPHRAMYISVRGGVAEAPCPYKCISERYHMPHCYTALEELIYTFGGPWLFGLLLSGLLILLALVLSVARMKFVGTDELPGPAPTQHGSQIDHSFPFLESLNEVLETNRAEESQSHVHRMYFMGPNTFSEPWHLPHSPPDQITEIVYEDAFNRFVDEINTLSSYQWWEGALHSILCILAYPLAWSWQQWRRRKKLQRLREFVRSEYDHSCLRSCRSRALYEGLKVAATPDLMLAYVDFFLGGDEKRPDLPPKLHQRFPICLIFGGDGSYMAPFTLHSDNVLTSLMSQAVPPTIWYRLVAGLNAQLRLVRKGRLRSTLLPVLTWLQTHANPALKAKGVCVDLGWFQATALGYCQLGVVVYGTRDQTDPIRTADGVARAAKLEQPSRLLGDGRGHCQRTNDSSSIRKNINGGVIDSSSLRTLEEKTDMFYPFSLIVHNSKPIGHQDLVGLVISILLLGDFSLVLLTLLQLYSFSLGDVFLVLFVLPMGILSPFPAGINALFSHGPRRSAGLARVYALWNITSLVNVGVAFICGFIHYKTQSSSSKKTPSLQPWSLSTDESGWWMFPCGLVICKCIQAWFVDWHVANLEIQDRSLYSNDSEVFWQS